MARACSFHKIVGPAMCKGGPFLKMTGITVFFTFGSLLASISIVNWGFASFCKGGCHDCEYHIFFFSECRFELGLEKPDPKRALQSAFTIALAYVLGGLVPLVPYMVVPRAGDAVIASVVLTLVALLIFGYGKGHFTGNKPFRSALQTALIGALASGAAFGMAKMVRAIP